jgi:alpha-ribazole phosphatase
MDIVFIRHGRTNLNIEGRYGGSLDSPISLEGIEEIKEVSSFISNIKFDYIFTSPLKRAVETARIIGDDFIIDNRLREMDFGVFEGLSHKEVIEKYPVESQGWSQDFINYNIPKGESLFNVYKRTEDFIKEVREKHKKILVVTHGGVIGCALSMVLGGPHHYYRFKVSHGGVSIISSEDNFMYIKALNLFRNIEDFI